MQIRPLLLAAALLLLAAPAAAQTVRAQTVRAGMTAAEVRAALGQPALVREVGEWTYLYYANGCAPRCGSDDVVFVQGGRVVAAVFRTPRRRFVGPPPSAALEGAPARTRAPGAQGEAEAPGAAQGRRVEGIRIVVPGTGNVSLGAEGEPPRGGIVIRGGAGADTLAADTVAADTALDRTRQLREGQVTPRTIPPDDPGAAVRPDTALDASKQRREERVRPRVVTPPTRPR